MPSRTATIRRAKSLRRRRSKSWCRVYVLRDPKTDAIIYVGQTRSAPEERLRNHFKETMKGLDFRLSPIHQRIAACLPAVPRIEVMNPEGVWDISEAVWSDRLRREGHPLLNVLSIVADRPTPSHLT